jgi:NADH dehydrogenase [ubiquinone] 1 alpha subcomplex assembly factor 7
MNALGRALAARIRATGPITLADWMAEALTHPALGYYRRGDPLGAAGDFITAPEISQMFGELIGLWLVAAWERLGRPDPVALAELGPGRGSLMADALRAARVRPEFGAAVRLHLVESSPGLRGRQAAALASARPEWHDGFETVPEAPLLLIANEFFDALPIRQFQRAEAGWCERMVALDDSGDRFRWVLAPPSAAAEALLAPEHLQAAVGTVAEISPAAQGLAAAIGARLAAAPGAALIVDYGHDRSAPGDTLQAVHRHAPADPLEDPGEADLTAHVDFAALARAARTAGAEAHGPVAQGAFLRTLGIELRAERLLARATPEQAHAIRSGLSRLIDAAEMGRLFRVLALTSPGFGPPAGFEQHPG